MIRTAAEKQNISMDCRMLFSRACHMAGAFGFVTMRLLSKQCS